MPEKALPVVIRTPRVVKSFDKKRTADAPRIVETFAAAKLKSGKLKVTGSVSKSDKGFEVRFNIDDITCDEAKKEMSVAMTGELYSLPDPKMFASFKGKGKASGIDLRKLDGDLRALLEGVTDGLVPKIRKGLEAQVDKM